MTKKLLSIILAITMAVSLLPTNMFALAYYGGTISYDVEERDDVIGLNANTTIAEGVTFALTLSDYQHIELNYYTLTNYGTITTAYSTNEFDGGTFYNYGVCEITGFYHVTVYDLTLSSIALSSGSISSFSPVTKSYEVTVESDVSSITVTPTLNYNNGNVSIKVNGTSVSSGSTANVSLNTGTNTIEIVLTASDTNNSSNTYTLTVTREEEHVHTAAEAVVENNVPATCTTEGSYDEVVYCTVCGEELSRYQKIVSATGHTAADPVVEKEVDATCTTDGSYDKVVYCSVCDEEISRETITVLATGHTASEAVTENVVNATCTEDGSYDSVVYCSVCNTELSRETVTVEATGHTYVDGICIVCGAEDPDYVKVTAVTIDGEHALAEILPSGLVSSVTVSVDLGEISVGTVDGEHKLEAIADAMGFTLYNDSHGEWLLKNTEEFLIRENSRIRKVTAIFYGDIDFEDGATVTMSFETTSSALSSATIHVVHYTNSSWKEETSTSTYQEGTLTVTFQPDSSSPFLVLAVTDYNSSSRDNPLPLLLQIGALNQSTTDEPTEETTEEVVEIDEPVEAGETDTE